MRTAELLELRTVGEVASWFMYWQQAFLFQHQAEDV